MALPHSTPAHWQPHEEDAARKDGYWQAQHARFHDKENDVHLLWSSRRHRKGLEPQPEGEHADWDYHRARHYRLIGFDWGDISWNVAMLFLVGSIFWVVNGCISFNGFNWTTQTAINSASATAFMGGTIFFIGGYLSWVEALNPAPAITFGAELKSEEKRFVEGSSKDYKGLGQGRQHFGRHATLPLDHRHPSSDRFSLDKKAFDPEKRSAPSSEAGLVDRQASDQEQQAASPSTARPKWRWYGSTKQDWHSLGYVANTLQFFGASVFWIAVLTGLPGVLPADGLDGSEGLSARTIGLWDGLYWAPQIIAAPWFTVSGIMFMIEEQESWWRIKPLSMGWHVGLWNAIGGLGFFFCGVFGIWRETVAMPYQEYGSALSTYWGSFAFLIGSYLQFLETLNKR